MADITQDLLSLQYSQNFTIDGMQEANIDLSLPPAPTSLATVYGLVTDGALPIANATIKLFDSTGTPYMHTLTDATGAYTLDNIPAGTYSLAAVADGYRLSGAQSLTLLSGASQPVNFTLTADATLALGAIAGTLTVTTLEGQVPLGGAKVSLNNAGGETIATTYTADDGEFIFYDVADGAYTLTATATGYQTAGPLAVTVAAGSFANVSLSTQVDTRTYSGTVSGIIRDQNGAAVADCFVGLYLVNQLGQEQLLAATKTNTDGKYLFGNVLAGQYLVKAKISQ